VRYLAPSFGGINLEDISAPRCFEIEDALQDLEIPVFHDDQHGTAVVLLAALTNALKVVDKRIETIRVAFSGAGAAAMACAKLVVACGATNVTLVDSQGIIHREREGLTPVKEAALSFTNPDELRGGMSEAMAGADVFAGLSRAGVIDEGMVAEMADRPIVFAMANSEPEIMPEKAYAAGAALVGTGRSDLPNQVNNSLGFPGIFGAPWTRGPPASPTA
jgi:malate dehydrogenase (oxaloacetate-decarboxylating)